MKIYIASSWKNALAVRLVTDRLRVHGYEVLSFLENCYGESYGSPDGDQFTKHFEEWVWEEEGGGRSFDYDVSAATMSDAVVYIGPSGVDTWAEVGAAFGAKVPVYGVYSKGETVGLMRRMITWCEDIGELFDALRRIVESK